MSADDLRDSVVSEYAQTLIRVKARQLCRRPGFCRSDEEDLKQELSLLLFTKLQKFNPNRATLNTFIDRVVDSGVRMLLRSANRIKRRGGVRAQSLDAERSTGPEQPLRDSVSQDAHARRTGQSSADPRERFVDCDAIQHALESLPDELRHLCELLKEIEQTPLSAQLGMSRYEMRQTITQVREYFVRAGFGNASDSRTRNSETA